jgi:hypothetical protein
MALQTDRRKFLALTGLTPPEFQRLLAAFPEAYQRVYPADQTAESRPRRRAAGGGRQGQLHRPEDKLLFLLVYLKAYPLQVVMGELFGLSQPQVNYWIHRLLPAVLAALDRLGVRPERDPGSFPQTQPAAPRGPRLIIDATERRRQRPKNPEKQALHYSGRKKKHCDKNVVLVNARRKRIDYLSPTYPGKAHEKKIADAQGIAYPPGAVLYKDSGFQGYEPAVKETRQAKKKAAAGGTHGRGEAGQPEAGPGSGESGTRPRRGETVAHRQRRVAEHQSSRVGCRHGSVVWPTQPPSRGP